jgi:hypothetical protein
MNEHFTLDEETCRRLIGYPIVAVLHDDSRHYGIISKVGGGKLILNDNPATEQSAGTAERSRRKTNLSGKKGAGKSGKSRGGPANVSAYPAAEFGQFPFPSPFGARVALELSSVAGLFPLL